MVTSFQGRAAIKDMCEHCRKNYLTNTHYDKVVKKAEGLCYECHITVHPEFATFVSSGRSTQFTNDYSGVDITN